MSGPRLPRARDAGMVTAETAAVLPVLVLVAALAVALVLAAGQRVRLVDAAHTAALAAARDDPDAARFAARLAPGATIDIATGEDLVTVTVRRTLTVGPFTGPAVSATAVAPREPGPAGAAGPGP